MKKMKAIVKTKEGPGNVELMEMPVPEVKENEVKIKVDCAGICGTDVKIKHGDTWSNPPVILGHEFSGVVEEVGRLVTSVKPGDRVVSETAQIICGHCEYCNTANQLMCPERLSIGYGTHGAFANYCVVREAIVHKIPEGVSMEEAALAEPSAVAAHAVMDSVHLEPTDLVIVMGPGTIGLLVSQIVKSYGCEVVITGTDVDEARLEVAKELGMDHIVNVQKQDLVEFMDALTAGRGADVVFDCTGVLPAIRSGMSALKKKGKFVQIGLTKQNLEIEYGLLPQREISLIGTFGHNWKAWENILKMISQGKLKTKPLITHTFGIDDWEKAFEIAEKCQGIKILIKPNEK